MQQHLLLYLLQSRSAVSGGSGVSATPTLTLGTEATFTMAFTRTFTYTWNIPDIVINNLGRLFAVNISASGYTATTPYTFRVLGLQYDSCNSFYSDYGNPILSMAQQTNMCSYSSIEYEKTNTNQRILTDFNGFIACVGEGGGRNCQKQPIKHLQTHTHTYSSSWLVILPYILLQHQLR